MVSVGKFDTPIQHGGQRGGIPSALSAMTTQNSNSIDNWSFKDQHPSGDSKNIAGNV